MRSEDALTPITERKVMRRGLLAGIAGLGGAALLKLSGAEKASAADGNNFIIGNTATAEQTATSQTRLVINPSLSGPGFQVTNGGPTLVSRSAITGSGDPAGVGVIGNNNNGSLSVSAIGVEGISNGSIAVRAVATSGVGLWGSVSTAEQPPAGVGVEGQTSISSVPAIRGVSRVSGTGVKGLSNSTPFADGNGSGIGVHGKSTGGPGVKGESVNQPGVDGFSISSLGVRGTSTNFVGVVGISTGSHGLYGSTSAPGAVGLLGENTGGGAAGYFSGNVTITGSLQVFGAKNAVIKMQDGTTAAVYCQEAPEPYFEDFGEARLAGGVAQVPLEPEFATLVANGKYMVFLTAEGATQGLYVSRKNGNGFEVRENSGTSNVPFSYRVVTKRKDIEGKRFARVSDDAKHSVAAARAAIERTPGPAGHP